MVCRHLRRRGPRLSCWRSTAVDRERYRAARNGVVTHNDGCERGRRSVIVDQAAIDWEGWDDPSVAAQRPLRGRGVPLRRNVVVCPRKDSTLAERGRRLAENARLPRRLWAAGPQRHGSGTVICRFRTSCERRTALRPSQDGQRQVEYLPRALVSQRHRRTGSTRSSGQCFQWPDEAFRP